MTFVMAMYLHAYLFFLNTIPSIFPLRLFLLLLQAEAGGSPAPMGPSAPLSEGPPQQPPQGAGQCAQLGLGQHGSRPLPAAPLAPSAPRHCAGAA